MNSFWIRNFASAPLRLCASALKCFAASKNSGADNYNFENIQFYF